eukprot:gene159-biopygen148
MPPKAVKRNRSVSASEADASIPKRIAVNRNPKLWLQLDTALTSVLPVGLSVRLMVFESSRRQLWEVRLFPTGELWIQAPQLERFRDRPVGRVTAVALEDLDLHKVVVDRFTAPAARVADRFNDEDECDSEVASVAEEEVVPQAFPAEASITRSEFQTFMLAVNQQLGAIQQKLSTSQPQGGVGPTVDCFSGDYGVAYQRANCASGTIECAFSYFAIRHTGCCFGGCC